MQNYKEINLIKRDDANLMKTLVLKCWGGGKEHFLQKYSKFAVVKKFKMAEEL